jgi:hypothetical protein
MRFVIRHCKEETEYIIEHQEDEFFDLAEVGDMFEVMCEKISKPQCCNECIGYEDRKRGVCPCPTVMSSL